MKRILILNPYVATLGGGEKQMGYLCQFFEQYYNLDLSIEILSFTADKTDINGNKPITVSTINSNFGLQLQRTKIIGLDMRHENTEWNMLRNKQKIEKFTRNYDIFVNFMYLSKHTGKAKTNLYACMFPPFHSNNKNILKKLLLQNFEKKFCRGYDRFITNSLFTDYWLKKRWPEIRNNTVIYPPVFTTRDNLNDRYVETLKQNIIISVGRFFVAGHNKKQLEMVEFFVENQDKLSNCEYHLVGQCSNRQEDVEYLEKIMELASKVNNVFIHTNSPYSDLIELYKKAKVFWHGTGYGVDEGKNPEKMEHFGITTVEAMSFGCVPVVINKGGQKETVEQGVNGFRWDTGDECVKFTVQLLNDSGLRKRMAEESVKRARDYSVDKFYEQNRKVMHELGI